MISAKIAAIKSAIDADTVLSSLPNTAESAFQIAIALNAKTESAIKPLRASTVFAWCGRGPYARIVDASLDENHSCRSACLALRDALRAGMDVHIDMDEISGMVDVLVAAGVFTADERTALFGLATKPVSVIEKTMGSNFMGDVTYQEVIQARAE